MDTPISSDSQIQLYKDVIGLVPNYTIVYIADSVPEFSLIACQFYINELVFIYINRGTSEHYNYIEFYGERFAYSTPRDIYNLLIQFTDALNTGIGDEVPITQ